MSNVEPKPNYTPYVALLVRQWLNAPDPDATHRVLEGSTVFADISGFTKLSERLDRIGLEGAEQVTEVIGNAFNSLLEPAYAYEGTLVTIPNSAVVNAQIDNLQVRPTRRTNFTIGVTYDTSSEKLQRAVAILRDLMEQHPGTETSRAHFKSYGESALILDVAHWCKHLDYSKYLACIEEINFELKRRFEDEGIAIAYPTQTEHLVNKEASRD